MKNKRNIIIAIVTLVLAVASLFFGIEYTEGEINKIADSIETVANIIDDSNLSTTEIPELEEADEQILEVQEIEAEQFEEQGEIAYNGSDKAPTIQLGEYAGLTYYSQIDGRWKNTMYSNHNDYAQTIGSSGCGPTSAAMIVSSIKGTITPDIMARLYTEYGYRSYNSGTYWSAFRWTADVFGIEYQETSNLNTAVEKLHDNNYVIASCGNGLFTYGGHFIVIIGEEDGFIKIYDPYLYQGKFETSTRKGKAELRGNTVYVSIENFKKHANAKGFFCFKNDREEIKENNTTITSVKENTSTIKQVDYNIKVTAKSGLKIRSGASISYSRIGAYPNGTKVHIQAENNNWGKTNDGWICLDYAKRLDAVTISMPKQNYTTGTYVVNCSKLNVRSGPGTQYRKKSIKELTKSAQKQGGYIRGVRFTVKKVISNWGLTPSGWVCLDYSKKI